MQDRQNARRIYFEDRASIRCASFGCRAEEAAVDRLNQARLRISWLAGTEAVKRRQRPRRINLEDRAGPQRAALGCRAVEGAVVSLDEPAGRRGAIAVIEVMKRRQRSRRIDLEMVPEPAAPPEAVVP